MIDIKNIMLGDWINLNFDIDYKTGESIYAPVQVIGINKDGTVDVNCTFDKSESMQDGWDLKLIEPIPLTEEILEKNGFHLMHGFGYNETYPTYGWGDNIDKKYISVDVTFYDDEPIYGVTHLVKIYRNSIKEDGVDSIHSCDIDYIHELQHALKLCKIEKEIIL